MMFPVGLSSSFRVPDGVGCRVGGFGLTVQGLSLRVAPRQDASAEVGDPEITYTFCNYTPKKP